MDIEQYIGCVIMWKGRRATVTGATDCYAGSWFTLQYENGVETRADAFDFDLLDALPDPEYGLIARSGGKVIYRLDGTDYQLTDHPYEPCLYIRKDENIICVLHNAFTADGLPDLLANGKSLLGIDGKLYDGYGIVRVLAAALKSGRGEMDFTFAARLIENDN